REKSAATVRVVSFGLQMLMVDSTPTLCSAHGEHSDRTIGNVGPGSFPTPRRSSLSVVPFENSSARGTVRRDFRTLRRPCPGCRRYRQTVLKQLPCVSLPCHAGAVVNT